MKGAGIAVDRKARIGDKRSATWRDCGARALRSGPGSTPEAEKRRLSTSRPKPLRERALGRRKAGKQERSSAKQTPEQARNTENLWNTRNFKNIGNSAPRRKPARSSLTVHCVDSTDYDGCRKETGATRKRRRR